MPAAAVPARGARRGGFQRSRALWDQVEQQNAAAGNVLSSWRAYARAILYELQPIRHYEIRSCWDAFVPTLFQLFRWWGQVILGTLQSLPAGMRMIRRHLDWRYIVALLVYCGTVRWIHQQLEAGPFVVILSVLAIIFTVGLSDEQSDGLSAYSVFNKGFQKILGSVDADALLQQYVGGGGAGMVMMNHRRPDVPDDDDAFVPLREQQQQQRPRRVLQVYEDDEAREQQQQPQLNHNQPLAAPPRRSNKKMRRQNAQQRREIQQQRQAAAALGLDGDPQNEEAVWNRIMLMDNEVEE